VDNLSGGRVDLAFTPGWSANDFALAPENYATRGEMIYESLRTFEKLWRGEMVPFRNGAGDTVELAVYPRPARPDRRIWLTCTRGRDRFEKAGELGANVLTALLMQTPEDLAENISAYRASRASHGHDPAGGVVTLMLHTYLGDNPGAVRAAVRGPLGDYILSSIDLWQLTAQPLKELPANDRARLIDLAFERYLRTSSLIGTVETALETARHFQAAGVNEIACLIDFGVEDAPTLASVERIVRLRDQLRPRSGAEPPPLPPDTPPPLTETSAQPFF
jgi:natural product biosynthesis luciferase-like monooxygenase protein